MFTLFSPSKAPEREVLEHEEIVSTLVSRIASTQEVYEEKLNVIRRERDLATRRLMENESVLGLLQRQSNELAWELEEERQRNKSLQSGDFTRLQNALDEQRALCSAIEAERQTALDELDAVLRTSTSLREALSKASSEKPTLHNRTSPDNDENTVLLQQEMIQSLRLAVEAAQSESKESIIEKNHLLIENASLRQKLFESQARESSLVERESQRIVDDDERQQHQQGQQQDLTNEDGKNESRRSTIINEERYETIIRDLRERLAEAEATLAIAARSSSSSSSSSSSFFHNDDDNRNMVVVDSSSQHSVTPRINFDAQEAVTPRLDTWDLRRNDEDDEDDNNTNVDGGDEQQRHSRSVLATSNARLSKTSSGFQISRTPSHASAAVACQKILSALKQGGGDADRNSSSSLFGGGESESLVVDTSLAFSLSKTPRYKDARTGFARLRSMYVINDNRDEEEEKESLEQEIKKTKIYTEEVANKLEVSLARTSTLESYLSEASNEKNSLIRDRDELIARLNEAASSHHTLQAGLDQLQQQLQWSQTTGRDEAVLAACSALRGEFEARNESLQQHFNVELNNVQSECAKLKDELGSSMSQMDSLSLEYSNLLEKIEFERSLRVSAEERRTELEHEREIEKEGFDERVVSAAAEKTGIAMQERDTLHQAELDAYQSSYSQVQEELAMQMMRVSELEAKERDLLLRIEGREIDYNKRCEQDEIRIAELATRCMEADAAIADQSTLISTLQEMVSATREELQATAAALLSSQEEANALRRGLEDIHDSPAVKSMEERFIKAEDEARQLSQMLESVSEELAATKAAMINAEAEWNRNLDLQHQQHVNELSILRDTYDQRVNELEIHLANSSQDVREKNNSLEQLRAEIESFSQQRLAYESSSDQLKQEVAFLQQNLEFNDAELSDMREERSKTQLALEEASNRLVSLQAEAESSSINLEKATSDVHRLTVETDRLAAELSASRELSDRASDDAAAHIKRLEDDYTAVVDQLNEVRSMHAAELAKAVEDAGGESDQTAMRVMEEAVASAVATVRTEAEEHLRSERDKRLKEREEAEERVKSALLERESLLNNLSEQRNECLRLSASLAEAQDVYTQEIANLQAQIQNYQSELQQMQQQVQFSGGGGGGDLFLAPPPLVSPLSGADMAITPMPSAVLLSSSSSSSSSSIDELTLLRSQLVDQEQQLVQLTETLKSREIEETALTEALISSRDQQRLQTEFHQQETEKLTDEVESLRSLLQTAIASKQALSEHSIDELRQLKISMQSKEIEYDEALQIARREAFTLQSLLEQAQEQLIGGGAGSMDEGGGGGDENPGSSSSSSEDWVKIEKVTLALRAQAIDLENEVKEQRRTIEELTLRCSSATEEAEIARSMLAETNEKLQQALLNLEEMKIQLESAQSDAERCRTEAETYGAQLEVSISEADMLRGQLNEEQERAANQVATVVSSTATNDDGSGDAVGAAAVVPVAASETTELMIEQLRSSLAILTEQVQSLQLEKVELVEKLGKTESEASELLEMLQEKQIELQERESRIDAADNALRLLTLSSEQKLDTVHALVAEREAEILLLKRSLTVANIDSKNAGIGVQPHHRSRRRSTVTSSTASSMTTNTLLPSSSSSSSASSSSEVTREAPTVPPSMSTSSISSSSLLMIPPLLSVTNNTSASSSKGEEDDGNAITTTTTNNFVSSTQSEGGDYSPLSGPATAATATANASPPVSINEAGVVDHVDNGVFSVVEDYSHQQQQHQDQQQQQQQQQQVLQEQQYENQQQDEEFILPNVDNVLSSSSIPASLANGDANLPPLPPPPLPPPSSSSLAMETSGYALPPPPPSSPEQLEAMFNSFLLRLNDEAVANDIRFISNSLWPEWLAFRASIYQLLPAAYQFDASQVPVWLEQEVANTAAWLEPYVAEFDAHNFNRSQYYAQIDEIRTIQQQLQEQQQQQQQQQHQEDHHSSATFDEQNQLLLVALHEAELHAAEFAEAMTSKVSSLRQSLLNEMLTWQQNDFVFVREQMTIMVMQSTQGAQNEQPQFSSSSSSSSSSITTTHELFAVDDASIGATGSVVNNDLVNGPVTIIEGSAGIMNSSSSSNNNNNISHDVMMYNHSNLNDESEIGLRAPLAEISFISQEGFSATDNSAPFVLQQYQQQQDQDQVTNEDDLLRQLPDDIHPFETPSIHTNPHSEMQESVQYGFPVVTSTSSASSNLSSSFSMMGAALPSSRRNSTGLYPVPHSSSSSSSSSAAASSTQHNSMWRSRRQYLAYLEHKSSREADNNEWTEESGERLRWIEREYAEWVAREGMYVPEEEPEEVSSRRSSMAPANDDDDIESGGGGSQRVSPLPLSAPIAFAGSSSSSSNSVGGGGGGRSRTTSSSGAGLSHGQHHHQHLPRPRSTSNVSQAGSTTSTGSRRSAGVGPVKQSMPPLPPLLPTQLMNTQTTKTSSSSLNNQQQKGNRGGILPPSSTSEIAAASTEQRFSPAIDDVASSSATATPFVPFTQQQPSLSQTSFHSSNNASTVANATRKAGAGGGGGGRYVQLTPAVQEEVGRRVKDKQGILGAVRGVVGSIPFLAPMLARPSTINPGSPEQPAIGARDLAEGPPMTPLHPPTMPSRLGVRDDTEEQGRQDEGDEERDEETLGSISIEDWSSMSEKDRSSYIAWLESVADAKLKELH